MKNFLSFIACTLGALAVLIAPMIPHHHHGEEVCVVMERCSIDNRINDTHTGHHGEDQDCSSCIKNAQWLDVRANYNRNVADLCLLPLFVVFGYEWHMKDVHISELKNHFCRSTIHVLEGYGGVSGLRAPPCFS